MIKNKYLLATVLLICLSQTAAFSLTTYKLNPGQSMVLTNTLNRLISAYCTINAVGNVVNSLSITALKGSGSFNGTTLSQGQTLFENVVNTQYIPVKASIGASARISNVGVYAIQAQCS